ncbi:cathepsin L2-like [Anopheles darlingi]|uniref:cathepsin L2-like n=1 Tax=Anopheles darlingi TaxID=43151 RepID=UPI0021006063|nr:cathepsin L2-like [Anopheles darlingi]
MVSASRQTISSQGGRVEEQSRVLDKDPQPEPEASMRWLPKVCLILALFATTAWPQIGVTAQRKRRPTVRPTTSTTTTIMPVNHGSVPGVKAPPVGTALPPTGKRCSDGSSGGMVSLSQELETVPGTEWTIVGASRQQPDPSPKVGSKPVAKVNNGTSPDPGDTRFRSYMQSHHKRYYAKYRADRRRSAFLHNLEEINEHNQQFKAGKSRFRLAPNAFADMPNSEYRKRLVRLKTDTHRKVRQTIADELVRQAGAIPEALDWREKGFKTEAANQKSCGSCYAFSVGYAIAAQLMKHIGRVELVSEQQMVDCSTSEGNLGCGGGSLRNTLKYLEKAGGVMRQVDYPYANSVGNG